jgi:hypothetical protein
VHEFRYGGEIVDAAGRLPGTSGTNLPGIQRERWFHRLGCRRWLAAERDVQTNFVQRTRWLVPHTQAAPGHLTQEEGRSEAADKGNEP